MWQISMVGVRPMKIKVYQCSKCGQEIYSRANHDLKSCDCGLLSVDGGSIYNHLSMDGVTYNEVFTPFRILGDITAKSRIVELNVTIKELYDDWNNSTNNYGYLE